MHFAGASPRAGAYFAVPIVLATGEVAGMLCADTVKTPHGGDGRAIAEEDKDLMRALARSAGVATDAAGRRRPRACWQRRRSRRRSPRRWPPRRRLEEGDEAPAEGESEAAEPEPEEEAPPEPGGGRRADGCASASAADGRALASAARAAQKALAAAEKNLARKQKRFDAVKPLIDVVDDDALAELRSLPRAPKATWRVVKGAGVDGPQEV